MAEQIDLGYEDLEFVELTDTSDALTWKASHPGDSIIGKYIETQQGKGRGEGLTFHILEDTHAQKVSILGGTVLNDKLEQIEPGTIIKIEYKGKATNQQNGREYHKYIVSVAKDK